MAGEAASQNRRAGRRLPREDVAPLESQTLEVRDFPGYRREKFVFQSRPGVLRSSAIC